MSIELRAPPKASLQLNMEHTQQIKGDYYYG